MVQRVFLSPQNTSKFICNGCNRNYEVDMSKYVMTPNTVKLRVKCKCGYEWDSILEKRGYYRKKVNLPGTYRYQMTGRKISWGQMYVLDISRTGLKIKIDGDHTLEDGDWIEVEFRLDNSVKTLINRMVNIKNVNGQYLGTSFREAKHFDPVIGFYMLQHTPPKEKPSSELILKNIP